MSGITSAKPDYTLPYEQTVLSILRDFGIVRAQLFGSAARGELTPASDIDILVKPGGPVVYGELFLLHSKRPPAEALTFLHQSRNLSVPTLSQNLLSYHYEITSTIH